MNIADLFKKEHTVFSFEVFPPKKESGIETIYSTLNELKNLNPDFISVTYGAGGKGVANATTIDLCSYIKNELGTETIAHLSCLYNTKESIDRILDELDEKGVKNILALRGDVNPDFAIEKDFKYASDLTEYIVSKNRGFNVSGACYPEVHQEAANMIEDIQNLKKKVDSGADHLISQLFFDDQVFFDFQEKARIAGINVPIEAGIMPVTNRLREWFQCVAQVFRQNFQKFFRDLEIIMKPCVMQVFHMQLTRLLNWQLMELTEFIFIQ